VRFVLSNLISLRSLAASIGYFKVTDKFIFHCNIIISMGDVLS